MFVDPVFSPYFSSMPRSPEVLGAGASTARGIIPSSVQIPISQSGVVLDISPEGMEAYARYYAAGGAASAAMQAGVTGGQAGGQGGTRPGTPAADKANGIDSILGPNQCETCNNRRYVDQSNDSSVSFQAPTRVAPSQAASAVASHEREHIVNEQARAERDDRRVISQSVRLNTSICPECGKVYISGGSARTVTGSKPDNGPEVPETGGESGQAQ